MWRGARREHGGGPTINVRWNLCANVYDHMIAALFRKRSCQYRRHCTDWSLQKLHFVNACAPERVLLPFCCVTVSENCSFGHRSFYVRMLNNTSRQSCKFDTVHIVGHLKKVPPIQGANREGNNAFVDSDCFSAFLPRPLRMSLFFPVQFLKLLLPLLFPSLFLWLSVTLLLQNFALYISG